MLRSYLKIAWRQLKKNRLFSLLNIGGLSIGITVFLLLFLHIRQEESFDMYHAKASNIYRLIFNAKLDEKREKWGCSPNIAGPSFKAAIPGILSQSRWIKHEFGRSANILYNEKKFFEKNLYWADSSITSIFDIPFTRGNPATALVRPNTIIISQTIAQKYFGSDDPMGKSLKIDNNLDCEITGVYKDFPANSTLDADFIGSFYSVVWMNKSLYWGNASYETWFLLNDKADPKTIEREMTAVVDKDVPKKDQWFSFALQPLKNIHLYSSDITNTYVSRTGSISQVKIVSLLALVILLIACINYMNLATARSQNRFREVGINKTMGATARLLLARFYAETALFVILSVVVGIALLFPAIPFFNRITGEELQFVNLANPSIITALIVVVALTIIVAGSYPAIYLSSFNPKNLFHQVFHRNSLAGKLRQSLVVIQFAASVILIISTFLFYRQLQYIQNKQLGFHPEQVVAITTTAAQKSEQIDGIINETKSLAGVVSVCRSQTYPGKGASGRSIKRVEAAENDALSLSTCRATADILAVLDIKLLAGTSLPTIKSPTDSSVQIVINKTALNFLGYTPQQAIGKRVNADFGDNTYIVGVTEDFNTETLHKPIGAYAFHNATTEGRNYMLIKLQTGNLKNTMSQIEQVFHKNIPNGAFEYSFLDQYMQSLYVGEQRTASIVLSFSVLAIFIACLGLFGLAAFMAEQRRKEIGIRKVLGASVANITAQLSVNFLKLVLFSVLLASPVAWWLMNKWLQDFAYRISINAWVFIAAGSMAFLIALITISFQSIRAALASPIKSLRTE